MDLISLDDDQPPQEQQQQLSTQENEMKEQAQAFQSAEVCSLCVFVYLACACAHVCVEKERGERLCHSTRVLLALAAAPSPLPSLGARTSRLIRHTLALLVHQDAAQDLARGRLGDLQSECLFL